MAKLFLRRIKEDEPRLTTAELSALERMINRRREELGLKERVPEEEESVGEEVSDDRPD